MKMRNDLGNFSLSDKQRVHCGEIIIFVNVYFNLLATSFCFLLFRNLEANTRLNHLTQQANIEWSFLFSVIVPTSYG